MEQNISILLNVLAILLFPAGWLATNVLNNAQEIRKRRLELRLQMLHSFLPVWFEIQQNSAPFTNPSFLPKLEDARSKFQLYGKKDEIEKFEAFIKAIEGKNLTKANEALSALVSLVRIRIRKEISIS